MPTPLTNDRWDFPRTCFVCEPSNAIGPQIPFQLDDDGRVVSASFTIGREHAGAPTRVHGGVSLAVLDEAQAALGLAPEHHQLIRNGATDLPHACQGC